ncbi:MAG: restriction endonuclease subunit S [Candidatus Electrothrix sp. AW2]|nr:restriction endonuclease subunit S [Candidatus Electrothrix gigas]
MKPYPRYKDSGVEWIGEVPEGWDVKPLKYVAAINEKTLTDKTDKNYQFYYIDIGNVTLGKIAFPKKKTSFESAPSRARRLVEDGDTIISTVRTYLKAVANINIDDSDIVVSTGFAVVSPKFDYDKKYFSHLLTCEKIIYKICSLSVGISYPAVNSSDIANIQVWYPVSKEEQTVIATFLDRKTAEIDKLIANKERLIKLYEEKKQAVINQAVTKGLDPDAEMRESGVEWLGEIPEHWEVLQLDYLIRVKARLGWKGLKASEYVPEGYGFLSTPNIKGAEIDYETINFISEDRYLESPEIMLQYNDVLLAKDGSTLGIVNIVKKLPFACTVNSSIAVLRVVRKEKILPDFLKYFMSCEAMQQVIERVKGGMGVPHLFQGDINKFKLLSPTIMEQTAIVHHIETQCSRIDAIINKLKKQINLFKEYRTALISEAVTGKIQI